MPPRAASCPGNDIFLTSFVIYLHFLKRKLAPWMTPRVDARGRRTVRTPSARQWVLPTQNKCITVITTRGGDLGGLGGRSPPNLRWGDGPCIGPPIFREVVLLDARESTNRVKKVLSRNFGVKMEIFR